MDGHNLVQEYFEFIILLKIYNTKTLKSVPIHPMLRYMLFSNSLRELPGNVILTDIQIDRVSSTKFLGLHIDDKLSWKLHVDHYLKGVV